MGHHVIAFVGYDDAAELGLVVIAWFAVLILVGLYLITQLFSSAFRKIPVVGPPIASAFDWVTRWARGAMMKTWHGTLWAAGKIAHTFAMVIQGLWLAFKDCLNWVADAIEHQAYVVIPREIRGVRNFAMKQASAALRTALQYANSVRKDARTWANQARTYAHDQVAAAEQRLNKTIRVTATELYNIINADRQKLQAQITSLNGTVQRLFGKAESDIAAARAELTARVDRDFAQAEADIHTALRTAETYAHDQAAAAERDAVAAVNTAIADAGKLSWPPVTAMIGELQKAAGTDFPALLPLLALVPDVIPDTAPAAVAAADAVLPPILRLMTDCVVPNCRDLGPLRNLLHTISGDVFLAALLAWVIYCIEDPAGAAQDTVTVADPVVSPVASALIGLVGGL